MSKDLPAVFAPSRFLLLHQDLPSRSRLPFVQALLSLRSRHHQLNKTVQGSTESEKAFENTCEKVGATSHELRFIKLQLDPNSSGKRDSVLRRYASEMWAAVHLHDAINDVLRIGGPANVIQAQDFPERLRTFLHQRKIIERQM